MDPPQILHCCSSTSHRSDLDLANLETMQLFELFIMSLNPCQTMCEKCRVHYTAERDCCHWGISLPWIGCTWLSTMFRYLACAKLTSTDLGLPNRTVPSASQCVYWLVIFPQYILVNNMHTHACTQLGLIRPASLLSLLEYPVPVLECPFWCCSHTAPNSTWCKTFFVVTHSVSSITVLVTPAAVDLLLVLMNW